MIIFKANKTLRLFITKNCVRVTSQGNAGWVKTIIPAGMALLMKFVKISDKDTFKRISQKSCKERKREREKKPKIGVVLSFNYIKHIRQNLFKTSLRKTKESSGLKT